MSQHSLQQFLASPRFKGMRAGVLTVVFCEDAWMLAPTLAHAEAQRPAHVLIVGQSGEVASSDTCSVVVTDLPDQTARVDILNTLIAAVEGRWIHWLEAGEFFFFPWCETRTINDIATFMGDERRSALFTYALDLYAPTLPGADRMPTDTDLWFDHKAYHAFPGEDRRLAVFGGLGWRFEEFFPPHMQPIGRASMFRARRNAPIGRNLIFEDAAYQSVSAPWHHSPTAALMSLRRARHLMSAPRFEEVERDLIWNGSTRFDWHSGQLLDLGMIEPGQWF